jgi:hypothetical protein
MSFCVDLSPFGSLLNVSPLTSVWLHRVARPSFCVSGALLESSYRILWNVEYRDYVRSILSKTIEQSLVAVIKDNFPD